MKYHHMLNFNEHSFMFGVGAGVPRVVPIRRRGAGDAACATVHELRIWIS